MWQGVILGNMPDAFESLADFVERMRDDERCVNFIGLSRTDLSSEQGMRLAEMIGRLGPPVKSGDERAAAGRVQQCNPRRALRSGQESQCGRVAQP